MVRFISDLHLYDSCMFAWRPGVRTLIEYSDIVLRNWNETVSDDDVTIVVGDIGNCHRETLDVFREMRGTKVLVVGNHDMEWIDKIYESQIFAAIHKYLFNESFLITHIPKKCCTVFPTYRIHGHHHEYTSPSMFNAYNDYVFDVNRFNCCADLIGTRPRTLTELMMFKAILIEEGIAAN